MPGMHFQMDDRLGIPVPQLLQPWEWFSEIEQSQLLMQWDHIRGKIPDRIIALERVIMMKQDKLFDEESFELSCELNSEIADLASTINDLNLWYRTDQSMDVKLHH